MGLGIVGFVDNCVGFFWGIILAVGVDKGIGVLDGVGVCIDKDILVGVAVVFASVKGEPVGA